MAGRVSKQSDPTARTGTRRRAGRVLAIVVCLLALVSGCGDGDNGSRATATGATSPVATGAGTESQPTSSDSTAQATATSAAGTLFAFVCGNGETGTAEAPTADIEQIDDLIGTMDLCEFGGGLVEVSFTAPCPTGDRAVTVTAIDGSLPDIATLDLCEAPGGEAAATVATVVADAQRVLDARFDENPDPPPGVVGALQIRCADDGPVGAGDVFACETEARVEGGFELDEPGIVFAVLDDAGTAAWAVGTDLPSDRDGLDRLLESVRPDLFCRDLVDSDADAVFFGAAGAEPHYGYFLSVVYWFLQGRPDRMDADGNGIPCETVHSNDVVAEVWVGGPVS